MSLEKVRNGNRRSWIMLHNSNLQSYLVEEENKDLASQISSQETNEIKDLQVSKDGVKVGWIVNWLFLLGLLLAGER